MPDISAPLAGVLPFPAGDLVGDRAGGIILIAAHDLQGVVRVISHRIEANQLVRHRDGEQVGGDGLPVIHRLVVEVRPVKIVVRIKLAVRAGIGEIQGFVGLHGHKDLHQREQPGEHAFMGIFLNLITCLAYRDAAFLELHMDDRHAVDQQHEISPAVAGKGRLGPEDGLLRDLIPALPGGDLLPVVDL